MTDTLVFFLPAEHGATPRWLRLAEGGVVARGEGDAPAAERVVAVAPAADVALHWTMLPDRSEAQALAAARLLAADASIAPIGALHIAIGREGAGEARPVAAVAAARMHDWLALLAAQGVDPDAIIPAPLLLPTPEQGYVRADLGGQVVIRGRNAGFADEAALTALLTAGDTLVPVEHEVLEAAVAGAAAAPALDLRQGAFARRRARAPIDMGQVRRLCLTAGAVLLLTFAIGLVSLARENLEAASLEERADALARQGLKAGTTVTDADRQLDERLLGLRGPGMGFTRTAGAVFAAVRAVPEAQLTAIDFDGRGALRVSISTQGEGPANDLKHQIEAKGFKVAQAGNFATTGGRITGDLMVTPQ